MPALAKQLTETGGSVVDLDPIDDAILALNDVMHTHRGTDLDAGADLVVRERLAALGDVDDLLAVTIGHRTTRLLDDEGLSRSIFGHRAGARGSFRCRS